MRLLLVVLSFLLFIPVSNALVDMRSANYSDTWTDIIIPGSGYDLRVVRTYNSRSLFNGMFGFGWCSDFETKLEQTAESNIKVTECGGGMEVVFAPKLFDTKKVDSKVEEILKKVREKKKNLDEKFMTDLKKELRDDDALRDEFAKKFDLPKQNVKESTPYYADGRENETVVLKGSGKDAYYQRTLPDGTYQKFDQKGFLTHMYDKNGNFLKIERDRNNFIKTVVDNNGRKLDFTVTGAGKALKVVGPGGLTATYTFKGEDLIEMTNGAKQKYKYQYDDVHNLTKVDFGDKTFKNISYDKDKDWVTSFTDRRNCVEKYAYESDKEEPLNHYWSTVTKTCGKEVVNQSKYEFFYRPRSEGTGRYLYRSRTENNGSTSDITYHEVFGKPVIITTNGSRSSFDYFSNGLVKAKHEETRSTNFEYNSTCNKISNIKVSYFAATPTTAKGKEAKRTIAKTVSTDFTYDKAKCNLMTAKNSDGQFVSLEYDTRGRIAKIVDQAKKVVDIKYEERFGKPSVVSRPGLGTIAISYKPDGAINKVDSKEGPTVAVQVASVFNNLLDLIAPATSELSL